MKTIRAWVFAPFLCYYAFGASLEEQSLPSIERPLMDRYQKLIQIDKEGSFVKEGEISGDKIYVRDFNVTGNSVVSYKTIDKLLEPFKQKELNIEEINKAAFAITSYYRGKKYFAARAYIPKQNMRDGVLQITILEGKYGEINVKNSSLVSDYYVVRTADALKKTEVVSTKSMERALLILNDTYGVKVDSAIIKEGSKMGESDFYITLVKRERIGGYAVYDNYGDDYIGKYRLGVEMVVNSPGMDGDRIEARGLVSSGGLVKNYSFGYKLPIGNDGLKVGCDLFSLSYKLSGEYASLDSAGESVGSGVWISYPFIKKEGEELAGVFGVEQKRIEDEIKTLNSKLEKRAHSAYISSTFLKIRENFELDAGVRFTFGRLYFQDALERERDRYAANTAGTYGRANMDAKIKLRTSINSNLTLSIKAQKAIFNKNLDGAEDFSISGAGAVKAFPSGEFSAENGYIASVSQNYAPSFLSFINGYIGVFADHGRGYMQNNTLFYHGRSLSDVGVAFGSYGRGAFVKAEAARIIGSERIQSEQGGSVRALFQAGYEF